MAGRDQGMAGRDRGMAGRDRGMAGRDQEMAGRDQEMAGRDRGMGDDLFWDLAEALLADPAVSRSTMMGLPCLRLHGRFFAAVDRRTQALLVKLPASRVAGLITGGHGEPFAPAGRVFREWVALPHPDRQRWSALLGEAREYATGSSPSTSAEAPPAG